MLTPKIRHRIYSAFSLKKNDIQHKRFTVLTQTDETWHKDLKIFSQKKLVLLRSAFLTWASSSPWLVLTQWTRVVSFRCLFNIKANASETEYKGKTAYIDSSLEYTTDYKLVCYLGKYVQGVFLQQTPKGWNHTSTMMLHLLHGVHRLQISEQIIKMLNSK